MEEKKSGNSVELYGSTAEAESEQILAANQILNEEEDKAVRAIVFGKGLSTTQINKIALFKHNINPFTIAEKISEGLNAKKFTKVKEYVKDDMGGNPIFDEKVKMVDDFITRKSYIDLVNGMVEDKVVNSDGHNNMPKVNILINNNPETLKNNNPQIDFESYVPK